MRWFRRRQTELQTGNRTPDEYREQAEAIVARHLAAQAEGRTFRGHTDWGEPMTVVLNGVDVTVAIEGFTVSR